MTSTRVNANQPPPRAALGSLSSSQPRSASASGPATARYATIKHTAGPDSRDLVSCETREPFGNTFDTAMILDTVLTVTPADLSRLSPDDAVRFTAELLWAEAARVGLPITSVNISFRIDVPDGGVDAAVNVDTPPASGILRGGKNVLQVKAGNFKPWQESQIRVELFGKGPVSRESLGQPVRDCMDSDGQYVLLCTGVDLTAAQSDKTATLLTDALRACDYENPRVQVLSQNQLIGALKSFPSLCLRLNRNGLRGFETFRTWSRHDQMSVPFKPGTEQQDFMAGLANEMRSMTAAANVHLRGEAGIGKTRLALESLRAEDLAPLVVYCDGPSRIRGSELLSAILREDSTLSLILVVDECDADARSYLWNKFKHRGPRIKFISIYGGHESTAGETVYMDAPPLADDQIVEILNEYIPPAESARRWSKYCSGSPRVAHVVGLNLRRNPDDLLKSPDTVPLWDRYVVGPDRADSSTVMRRRVVLRELALFRRFGFGADVRHEAQAIAALVATRDPSITLATFRDVIRDLKDRKILQGENTLYITPRLLHIKLWVEWWDRHGMDFVLDDFARAVPPRLLDWFFEMGRYAEESATAQRVFSSLLDERGPFQQSGLLTDPRGARFFLHLTEASPRAALQCLRKTVGTWSREKLLDFTAGRRDIVWALERLAIWRELFPGAARLLLRLADAENEEHIGNNATGVFVELFSPAYGGLAPTEASPEERFPVLKEAIEHESKECRRISLVACEHALRTGRFSRVVGAEHQGLKRQPKLWVPKTWGELFDAYRRVWRLLDERLERMPTDERGAAVSTMLSSARGLASVANLTGMVTETLGRLASEPYVDQSKVIEVVESVLHYDAKEFDAERVEAWEQLRRTLVKGDFSSRIRRWVGMDLLSDKFDESGGRADRAEPEVEVLAEAVVQKPELLDRELGWLTSGAAANGFNFGYALAKRDSDCSVLPKLLDAQRRAAPDGGAFFLGGYFRAFGERDRRLLEAQLDEAAEDAALRVHVPELTWRTGLNDRGARRISVLARAGHIGTEAFRIFSYGGVIGALSPPCLVEWIDFLLGAGTRTSAGTCVELCDCYRRGRGGREQLPAETIFRVLTAPALFMGSEDVQRGGREEYEWTELATAFIEEHAERSIEVARLMLGHFGEDGTIMDTFRSGPNQVLERVLRRFPGEMWEAVVRHLGPPLDSRAFHIERWLNGGALVYVPAELIWEWVERNVEERAGHLAGFIPKAFVGERGTVSVRELLVRYGSRSDVRSELTANFSSEMWAGPESAHVEGKVKQLRAWRMKETDSNVILWLDEYTESLRSRVEQAKVEEERREW